MPAYLFGMQRNTRLEEKHIHPALYCIISYDVIDGGAAIDRNHGESCDFSIELWKESAYPGKPDHIREITGKSPSGG